MASPFDKLKGIKKQDEPDTQTIVKRTSDVPPTRIDLQSNRVQTGIRGFDSLIQGGYQRGSINLLSGGPGTGKTIFGAEFIANGILMFNEPGVYISFDEKKESIFENMKQFGWDFEKLSQEGKFTFVEYNPSQLQNMLHEGGGLLDSIMSKAKAKRIVIDSISTFLMMSANDFNRREQLTSFFKLLRKWEITTLLLNEYSPISGNEISKETLSIDFETDSIVQLYYMHDTIGTERKRYIEIYKMRGTKHLTRAVPYQIDERGIDIITN